MTFTIYNYYRRDRSPISIDPATSYDVGGGEIIQNVYHTFSVL